MDKLSGHQGSYTDDVDLHGCIPSLQLTVFEPPDRDVRLDRKEICRRSAPVTLEPDPGLIEVVSDSL